MNDRKLARIYRDRAIAILNKAYDDGSNADDIAACLIHIGMDCQQYGERLAIRVTRSAQRIAQEHLRDLN
jgi:hypothetical protein